VGIRWRLSSGGLLDVTFEGGCKGVGLCPWVACVQGQRGHFMGDGVATSC
jgi:hypothetical protein